MALFGAAGSVVSRALVELDIDARQFDRKLDEADAKLREHGNVVGKTLKAGYLAGAAGVAVLTAGLAASAKVAADNQVVRAREQTQLKALNISYATHRAEIDKTIGSLSRMSGFNDTELTDSFTRLVATTHNVAGANHDLAIAVDVARARHISLEAATQLVTKASIGQTGALRRMGINVTAVKDAQNKLTAEHIKASPALRQQAKDLDQVATAHKALALLQQRYAGQSAAYGKTTAGEFARMHAAVHNLEIGIGNGILPVLSRLLEWLTRLVERLQASTKAHEIARAAVAKLHAIWNDLVPVLKAVWAAIATVTEFLNKHRTVLAIVVGVLAAFTAGWIAYTAAMKVAAAGQAVMNAVMDANPVVLVIAAVAALAVGFYELYKHVKIFREIVQTVFKAVTDIVEKAVGFIGRHWKLLASILTGPFGALAIYVATHFDTVKKLVTDIYHWLEVTALKIALAIVEPFSHLPGSMGKWARDAKDAINKQLDEIAVGAQAAGAAAGSAFSTAFMAGVGPTLNVLNGAGGAQGGAGATGAAGANSGSVRGGFSKGVASFAQAGIVATARSQIGISYKLGGPAVLGKSTDCSGLAIAVLRQNGIAVTGRTTWDLVKQGTPVTWSTLQAGDLVFFSIPEDGGPPPQHVGVYVGGGMMIHDPHTGASVETVNLDTGYWRARYYAARRYVKNTKTSAGGGATGAPGGSTDSSGAGSAHDTGVTSGSASAFNRAAAAAPRGGAKAAANKIAGIPSVDAVKRTLERDYGDLAIIHRAGLDGIIKKIRPEMDKIKGELGKPLTTKELAAVRNQLANLGSTINSGLTRAKAIIQSRKSEFERAWADFANKAMTAFDRVTQQHLQKMQSDTARAIQQMSITVQGPNGAFAYGAGQLTPAQQELQQLQDTRDEAARQQAIDDARKQVSGAVSDQEKIDAAKALDDALYAEKVAQLQKQGDAEQKAADDQLAAAQQSAQDLADQQQQDYQDQRQNQRDALQQQLDDLEVALEARKAAFGDANAILAKLMQQGGSDVGNAFIQGLEDALAAVGLNLSDYLKASGGGAGKDATAPPKGATRPEAAGQGTGGGGAGATVNQTLVFNDGRPATSAQLAASYAAKTAWAT